MSMLRKLRAIVSMGVVWGLAWIPLAIGSVTFLSVVGGRWPPLSLLTQAGLIGALTGGASGAIFGGLLAATEHRRTVASLSTRRVVLLGVLARIVPWTQPASGSTRRSPMSTPTPKSSPVARPSGTGSGRVGRGWRTSTTPKSSRFCARRPGPAAEPAPPSRCTLPTPGSPISICSSRKGRISTGS